MYRLRVLPTENTRRSVSWIGPSWRVFWPFDTRRTQFSASIPVESTSPRRTRYATGLAHTRAVVPPNLSSPFRETGDEDKSFPHTCRTPGNHDAGATRRPPGVGQLGRARNLSNDGHVELKPVEVRARFGAPALRRERAKRPTSGGTGIQSTRGWLEVARLARALYRGTGGAV